ncbi:MAG: hypothetical protein ACYDH9_27150 [Limisphaerales bacterium]
MAKAKSSETKSNGSTLGFEAQLWAAAEQAVPAPHCNRGQYNGARPVSNIEESRTLAALRDALLSGELRVPAAKLTEAKP